MLRRLRLITVMEKQDAIKKVWNTLKLLKKLSACFCLSLF
ncbi:hypothetical protein COK20_30800, partial [Bacillus cereus]